MNSVSMSEARSRLTGSPFRATERLDPFWDSVWVRGAVAQWRSRRMMERRNTAGLTRAPKWFLPTTDEVEAARERLIERRLDLKLGVLGAIDSWRTLSIEQCATILGNRGVMTDYAGVIRDLYTLDLVDVGHIAGFSDLAVQRNDPREWLIRPTRSNQYQRLMKPLITLPEAVKVHGGRDFLTGGQYDRHNTLSTEFALRISEFTRAGAVLGEKWSNANELIFEEWGRHSPFPHINNRGDITLLRRDGLRVVVELTASANGRAFDRKVARWAQQLSVQPVNDQGVVVLFLVCGEQSPKPGDTEAIRRKVQSSIVSAIRSHPGGPGNLVSERMFVASWADLFPGRHQLVSGFDKLPALAPKNLIGTTGMDRVWEPVHLFDEAEVPFQPGPAMDPLAAVLNAGILYGSPHWLRTEPVPQIAGDLARRKWPNGLPGVRPEDLAGKGVSSAITPPPRLLL